MRKQKRLILLLSITMAIIFAGLLIVQIKYISDTVKLRNNQFSESVKRSLIDIINEMESSEADKYLNIYMLGENRKKQRELASQNTDGEQSLADTYMPAISTNRSVTNKQNRHIYISGLSDDTAAPTARASTTNVLQSRLQNQYYNQEMQLENVAIRWLQETSELPILERVDVNELDIFIQNALGNNGINIPYHFSIAMVSKNGKWIEIYKCSDFQETKEQTVFDQKLFPKENTSKDNYLRLYFPTKDEYILSSMTLVLPSVTLTTLLLIIFTITLLIIFRQKKLDDIKNDFVSNMTHEFKTPISTISLASQMLQDQEMKKTTGAVKSISNVIKSETGRLSFLVEKILLMSIEHEGSTLKLAEINVNDLISNSIAGFSLKVENKGGQIISELNAENPWAMVDETHFTNVIFNLMDNAVKYSKEEEPLLLKLKTWNDNKGFLFISIEDNGIGIKKENLNKIFEKFYRVPTGNVHNVKGFGLGLAYVKKIINGHKGFVKAESECNRGTEFIIKIPTLKKID
jgi:signal transduction histidine kinase